MLRVEGRGSKLRVVPQCGRGATAMWEELYRIAVSTVPQRGTPSTRLSSKFGKTVVFNFPEKR
ncbi:MAG: hypothetical protein J5610_05130 [Prevotella sp.]|nr:hypothetical protein [Prevotella sp.]